MMVSKRALNLSPSETLKFTARAKELKAEGKSIVSLTAGEPDFKTPGYICDAAVDAIRGGHHGYTMNTGTPELRKAICAKLLRENHLSYAPEQIVVSNGAKQSIGFAILATIDPGDEVIIPAPYWVSYPEMVKMAEGTSVIVPTRLEDGYKITPEALKAAITPRTKGFILCSPSNPTGAVYSREELAALGRVLAEHPGVIIYSDEIYEYITFGIEHVSIAHVAPEIAERVVVVNGFSKGFAMTGWRLGYLAAHRDIAGAVNKIQGQETSAPSTISQMAGEAAYSHPLDEILRMRDVFETRRDLMMERMGRIDGVRCFRPDGAFYVFPDIGRWLPSTRPDGRRIETSTDFCMMALEEFGLGIVPGDAFGEPNCVRFSYAASEKDLNEGLDRFEAALDSLTPSPNA
jgi:aspartate aminotransferase